MTVQSKKLSQNGKNHGKNSIPSVPNVGQASAIMGRFRKAMEDGHDLQLPPFRGDVSSDGLP